MKKVKHKQYGVGLVEVLVALVVMSIGMLGIAGLYVTALQAKTTSGSRMKAVNFAYDIADRMRANPTASYTLTDGNAGSGTTNVNCSAANCSDANMALADLFLWDAALINNTTGTGLPGTVTREIVQTAAATATTPAVWRITIRWNEVNTGALSYALQVQI